MNKKTKVIIISVVSIFLTLFIFLILFITSIKNYNLNLGKETFVDSQISIMVPERWVLFDVKKYQEKKSGYEQNLLVNGSNFGGFPEIEIYSISIDTSEDYEKTLKLLIEWNIQRVEETQNENDVIYELPVDYLQGKLISYTISSRKTDLFQKTTCKDWAYMEGQTGYIISICENEGKWDKLNLIYNDIIGSFEVIE